MIELIVAIALIYFFWGIVGDFEFKEISFAIVIIFIIGAIFALSSRSGSGNYEYSESYEYKEQSCGRGCSY